MKKTIAQTLCTTLFVAAMAVTGCESNTGMVQPPETTAEEQAAIEARQTEYAKSMQESYKKR